MYRVALISHSPSLAGAERMLLNLALLVSEIPDYKPIVFIPNSPISRLKEMCAQYGITTVEMPLFPMYIFVSDQNSNSIADETLDAINNLGKLYLVNNIDLVISNTATSIAPVIAANRCQIPIFAWIHGILDNYLLPNEFDAERRLLFDRMTISLCDKTICCSNWTANYYNKYDSTSNLEVINNWTLKPKSYYQVDDNNKVFVCLNTIEENKGIFSLIKASALLKDKHSDFIIQLYGDGSENMMSKVKEMIEEFELEQNVLLMGRTNDIELVYKNCCCLVQPSFIESFGMTVIEAMSYHRPVIATKSGGPQEIIEDGETGFLIDRNCPEQIANKMAYFLENRDKIKIFGDNAYQKFEENYSEGRAKREFGKLFEYVLEKEYTTNSLKTLLSDGIEYILKSEGTRIFKSFTDTSLFKELCNSREIVSENLCFTGGILTNKKYKIICKKDCISRLGIIFAAERNGEIVGNVNIKVSYKNRVIRSCKVSLSDLVCNNWSYFNFEKLESINNKKLILELVFEYKPESVLIGVFEDRRKRSFLYRIFNKLGYSLVGEDVLYVDC